MLTDSTLESFERMAAFGTQISSSTAVPTLPFRGDHREVINGEVPQPSKTRSRKSYLLVDNDETLKVNDCEEFVQRLNCPLTSLVKVVSIFGNTGEGKSHTLNHAFFGGQEVFSTSSAQVSCTLGVWVAYEPHLSCVVVDTEGLLGASHNSNQRTRLLLKILAISDVVIFRTRAERLHNDLFQFLGDASRAYMAHFTSELNALSERLNLAGPLSSLGPVVIVFHETQHTQVLQTVDKFTPEEQLKQRFHTLGHTFEAFSALQYVGTQTHIPPTNFSRLQEAVKGFLDNSAIRSPRQPTIVYQTLKGLNEKFSGNIEKVMPSTFPDQYFTCAAICQSCGVRCSKSVNHMKDGISHSAPTKCRYQHQYDNKIYTCRMCHEQGREVVVECKTTASTDSLWMGLAKYAWSGYLLECPNCGIIFRSRQYWYGNRDPVETVARTEICHVWPGIDGANGINNTARTLLDGVTYVSSTVCNVSAGPVKILSSWVADRIAPDYWVPNNEITHCESCRQQFLATDDKHHCRACGKGFCEDCCNKFKAVPERGWGDSPVRVCKKCFNGENGNSTDINPMTQALPEVTARKLGEALHSTIGTVISTIDYPLGLIKESARPSYWVPDEDVLSCAICQAPFSQRITKHHCRACGQGVCELCSPYSRKVPSRGWVHPVRVCKTCVDKTEL